MRGTLFLMKMKCSHFEGCNLRKIQCSSTYFEGRNLSSKDLFCIKFNEDEDVGSLKISPQVTETQL